MTDPTTRRHELLEWIFDKTDGNRNAVTPVDAFCRDTGLPGVEGLYMVRDLAREGLVLDHSGMNHGSAQLTGAGIEAVLARRGRRADPAVRRAAARNSLLRWLYDQDDAGVHMPVVERLLDSDLSTFEGVKFSPTDVDRASEYLANHGLIKGVKASGARGPIRAEIETQGEVCIERYGGDVDRYLQQRDAPERAPQITNNIGSISASAVAVGSTNVTQKVVNHADLAALGEFVKTMLQELSQLQMQPELEEGARSSLAEAEQELTQEAPDRGRVAGAIGRFANYAMQAGQPVVTAILMMAAQGQGWVPTPGK